MSVLVAGKTRTRDKYRTVYTEKQRQELEAEFERSTYITAQRKTSISSAVGLSERQVKIWFQNRRAKDRKQHRRRASHTKPYDDDPQPSLENETETETNGSAQTSLAASASPLEICSPAERRFINQTLFCDPRVMPVTAHPTYYSTTAR